MRVAAVKIGDMSDPVIKRALTLYNNGIPLRTIGRKLNISHETVRKMIPRSLIRRKRLTYAEKVQIYKTYMQTGSFQETAEKHHISHRQKIYSIVKFVQRKRK